MTNHINQQTVVPVDRGTEEYWVGTKAAFAAIRFFDRKVEKMKCARGWRETGKIDEEGGPEVVPDLGPVFEVRNAAKFVLDYNRAVEVLEAQGRLEEVQEALSAKWVFPGLIG